MFKTKVIKIIRKLLWSPYFSQLCAIFRKKKVGGEKQIIRVKYYEETSEKGNSTKKRKIRKSNDARIT